LPHRTRLWHGILVACFAVILVAGTQALRLLGEEGAVPTRAYMSLVDDQLETMFLGSSHIGYGIDPRLYSLRGMNITAGALNYQCTEVILRKYLDQASNLRMLVLEAGTVPLKVDTMTRLEEDYRSLYRIGLNTFDLPLGVYRKGMQWLKESRLFYPVYFMDRLSPALLLWGSPPLGSEGEGRIDTLGHSSLDQEISPRNDGAVVVEHHELDHFSVDHTDINLPALLRVLKMAEDREIPVVFIRMPHHASYLEHRPEEWELQYQEMVAMVQKSIKPELLHYLDWEQRSEFKDRHFADADHLNLRGVQLLKDLLDPVLMSYPER